MCISLYYEVFLFFFLFWWKFYASIIGSSIVKRASLVYFYDVLISRVLHSEDPQVFHIHVQFFQFDVPDFWERIIKQTLDYSTKRRTLPWPVFKSEVESVVRNFIWRERMFLAKVPCQNSTDASLSPIKSQRIFLGYV